MMAVGLLVSACAPPDPTERYELDGDKADWTVAPAGDTVTNEDGSEVVSNVSSAVEEGIIVNTLTEFTINIGGSGSCPPIVTGVELNSTTGAVDVLMYDYDSDQVCTQDYTMYSYDVAVPSNAGFNLLDRDFNVCQFGECAAFTHEVAFETR